MRKRQIRLHIRLNDEEKRKLDEIKEITGLTYSAIIRKFLAKLKRDRILIQKPDEVSIQLIRELGAIDNNIRQICAIAKHSDIDTEVIEDFRNTHHETVKLLREKLYLF